MSNTQKKAPALPPLVKIASVNVNPLYATGSHTPATVDSLEVWYTNSDGTGRKDADSIEAYPPLDGPDTKGWKAIFNDTLPPMHFYLMNVKVTLGSESSSTHMPFSS